MVMLADLDAKQATSAEWAKRRKAAGLTPAIEARLTSQRQVRELSPLCNLLVIDAPGYADISTVELAERSDLLARRLPRKLKRRRTSGITSAGLSAH